MNDIRDQYQSIRDFSAKIAAPLTAEDCCIQSMDDVSPTRWHLAHTTWFFETFVLKEQPGYQVFDERFNYLFNSYYNTIGEQYPRSKRGLISRPGLQQVHDYRRHVDEALLGQCQDPAFASQYASLIRIGLNHEQQHQELMLTDIKHVLSCNPTWPAYTQTNFAQSDANEPKQDAWIPIQPGTYQIGFGSDAFAFDNEFPRHTVFLHDCVVSNQLVSCGDYLEFMQDDGYQRPELWLSAGWNAVNEHGWSSPLYWQRIDDDWMTFTLSGLTRIDPTQPVVHISMFEADAFARWKGKRLPTEAEWEIACMHAINEGRTTKHSFADDLLPQDLSIHPTSCDSRRIEADEIQCDQPAGLMGSVWQWTSSSYAAYPGYKIPTGAVGEYNGKFMCNQYVLRGGSVATSRNHIRPTYRNFFPADARWQFSGVRLAD